MSAPRKFDWEEARRLRAEGWTYAAIGRHLGVSGMAVRFACDAEARARQDERVREWQRDGTCPECGGPASRTSKTQHRCRSCAARAQTKVRDGQAYCPDCDAWKPLGEFSPQPSSKHRGVKSVCRSCDVARRREWRKKNPGRDLAATRRYQRRKREERLAAEANRREEEPA